MGRKIKDHSNLSEPQGQETQTLRETKAEGKKKKQKNKDQEEQGKLTQVFPKRKLEEIAPQEENSDSNKKKKKHKKSKDKEQETKDNVKETERNGDADEGESREQVVVVTGKDANEAKYKSLNSFAEAKLPSEVLQCCENFKSPSPIQSRAWPFLLDGRDFIGIAKTGSGKYCGLDFEVRVVFVSCFVWSS